VGLLIETPRRTAGTAASVAAWSAVPVDSVSPEVVERSGGCPATDGRGVGVEVAVDGVAGGVEAIEGLVQLVGCSAEEGVVVMVTAAETGAIAVVE